MLIAEERIQELPGGRTTRTGLFKEPVPAADVVAEGVVGDTVVETRHHGGPDQAVYVYGADDLAWWSAELGRPVDPGTFGENLTLSTLGSPVRIGDRYRLGEVVLEVTAPRIPCFKLAARLGDPDFVHRFRAAERPGFYARVLRPGRVHTGDPVERRPAPATAPTLVEVQHLHDDPHAADEALRAALAAPLAERTRAGFEKRLARR